MEISAAHRAFDALGQPTRLAVFRLLVQQGAAGLAAGDIARALTLPASTLSSHLATLEKAGLILSIRDGRSLRYSLNRRQLAALVGWLVQDCCGGSPELCAPVLSEIACHC
jgi:DNA-binding transcriptional ArsR family regulator